MTGLRVQISRFYDRSDLENSHSWYRLGKYAALFFVACTLKAAALTAAQADSCSAFTDSDKALVVTYLKRQMELPENTSLKISTGEYVGTSCYRKLTVEGLNSSQSMVAYLSPDKKFLIGAIADLTTDPREMRRVAREQADKKLAAAASLSPNKETPVTITEFIDYQCPYCRQFNSWLEGLPTATRNEISFRYVNLPLSMHPWAHTAALYGLCLSADPIELGKFQRRLFQQQSDIDETKLVDVVATLFPDRAASIKACVSDPKTTTRLNEEMALAQSLQVEGTPTFFIRGRQFTFHSRDELLSVVEGEIKASEAHANVATPAKAGSGNH